MLQLLSSHLTECEEVCTHDASFNLLTPLGRSSPWPCLNPPESTCGTLTRQPQSLQDHQNSCNPSVWRRASRTWAGGVYNNDWITIWAVLITVFTPNYFILYPRIFSMSRCLIILCGWPRCKISCDLVIVINNICFNSHLWKKKNLMNLVWSQIFQRF